MTDADTVRALLLAMGSGNTTPEEYDAGLAALDRLEAALREGGCQFYINGDIGTCQKYGEQNPCAACSALEGGKT